MEGGEGGEGGDRDRCLRSGQKKVRGFDFPSSGRLKTGLLLFLLSHLD